MEQHGFPAKMSVVKHFLYLVIFNTANIFTPAKLVENVVQAALQGMVSCKDLMLTPKLLAYSPAAVTNWLVMPLMVTFIWVQ